MVGMQANLPPSKPLHHYIQADQPKGRPIGFTTLTSTAEEMQHTEKIKVKSQHLTLANF